MKMPGMRLGIISDTHDRLPTMRRALELFRERQVEAVLHAGDYIAPFAAKLLVDPEVAPTDAPLYCIFGNNDGEREGLKNTLPQLQDGPLRVELGGRTIVMHHWIDWFEPDDLTGADVVIYGHNHEPRNEMQNGALYLNPGECCGWVTGRCTAAILDTESLEAEIFDIEPAE
jgi:putative phosphoesterase